MSSSVSDMRRVVLGLLLVLACGGCAAPERCSTAGTSGSGPSGDRVVVAQLPSVYTLIPTATGTTAVVEVADLLEGLPPLGVYESHGQQKVFSLIVSPASGTVWRYVVVGRTSERDWPDKASALEAIARRAVVFAPELRYYLLPHEGDLALTPEWLVVYITGADVSEVVCRNTLDVFRVLRDRIGGASADLPKALEPWCQQRAYRLTEASWVLRASARGSVEVMACGSKIVLVRERRAREAGWSIHNAPLGVLGSVSDQQFDDVATAHEAIVNGTVAPPTDRYALWVLPLMPSADFLLYRPDDGDE